MDPDTKEMLSISQRPFLSESFHDDIELKPFNPSERNKENCLYATCSLSKYLETNTYKRSTSINLIEYEAKPKVFFSHDIVADSSSSLLKGKESIQIKWIESFENNTIFLIMETHNIKAKEEHKEKIYLYNVKTKDIECYTESEKITNLLQVEYSKSFKNTIIILHDEINDNNLKTYMINIYSKNKDKYRCVNVNLNITGDIAGDAVAILNNDEISLIMQSESIEFHSYKFQIDKYKIVSNHRNFYIEKISDQNLNFKFGSYEIGDWPQMKINLNLVKNQKFLDKHRETMIGEKHEFSLSNDSNLANQFIPFYKENNFKCVYCYVNDPKGENKIFIFNDIISGIYSCNKDLIGVMSMTYEQFYIWEIKSLSNANLSSEMQRDIDYIGHYLWTLPKHYIINIKMQKIIFFAKLPNTEHSSNLMVVAVYDNMNMAKLEQKLLIHRTLVEVYNVKLGFSYIFDISLDDKFLVVLGKDGNKPLLRIFDTMFGNAIINIPITSASVSDKVWMNFGKRELFLKSGNTFQKIDFNFNSDIMCLNDNSSDQIRFLKFSPLGNYIIFKIYKRSNMYYKESHFGYIPYKKYPYDPDVIANSSINNNENSELFHKNASYFKKEGLYFKKSKIQNLDISDDEELLITLDLNKEIKIINISNPDLSYIKEYSLENLEITNCMIDVTGCIPEEETYRKLDCKRMHLSKHNTILNLVLYDKLNTHICVFYLNTEDIKNSEKVILSNYKLIDVESSPDGLSSSSSMASMWIKCIWNFSIDSTMLFFYFMNTINSKIVIFDLYHKEVRKEIDFGISLLDENIYIKNFLFSRNGENIISYNYKNNQPCVIDCNFDKVKELVKNDGRYFQLRLSFENNVFILETNTLSDKIEIKQIAYSKIIKREFDKNSFVKQLSFPMNRQIKTCYEENLILCATNDNIAYTNTQNDDKKFYNTIVLWWRSKSLLQTEIYDYNILKGLIGKVPSFDDIKASLRPELVNKTNDRYWSPLMSVAYDSAGNVLERMLEYLLNNEINVYYLTDKLKLAPISGYNTHSDVISMCIKVNSVKNLKILFKYLHKGIIYDEELALLICICKDELLKNYKFLYKELFKIRKKSDRTFKLEKKKFIDRDYICIADDSEMRDLRIYTEKYEKILEILKDFDEKNRNKEYPSVNLVVKNLKNIIKITKKIEAEIKVFLYDSDRLSIDKIMSILSFVDVEFFVFPWVDVAYAGYSSFLHHILENKLEIQAFDELSVKKLIDLKWKEYVRKYYTLFLILHICLIIAYSTYVLYDTNLYTVTNETIESTSDDTNENNTIIITADNRQDLSVLHIAMIIIALLIAFLCLIFNIIHLINVYIYKRKIISNKRKSILSALKNWAFNSQQFPEFLVYIYILIDTIGAFFDLTKNYYGLYVIKAFVICLLWWKFLYFLIPYKRLIPLILMFYTIFEDIGLFICILVTLFFGSSTAFYSLYYYPGNQIITYNNENNVEYPWYFTSFWDTLISTFGMMLGDFDLGYFSKSKSKWIVTLFFIAYILLMNVTFLNILIAILANKYNEIKEREDINYYIAKGKLIRDIESKLPPYQIEIINEYYAMKSLTIIHPVDLEEKKLEEISEKLNRHVKQIKQDFESSFEAHKEEIKEYIKNTISEVLSPSFSNDK